MEALLCQAKVEGGVQRAASFRGSIQIWIRLSPFLPDKHEMNKDPELKKDLLTRPGNGGDANKAPCHLHEKGPLQSQACHPGKTNCPKFLQFGLLPACPWCCSWCAEECELLLLLGLTLTPVAKLPESPGGDGAVGRGVAGPAAPSASATPLRGLKQEFRMEGSPGLLPPLLFFVLSSSSSLTLLPEAHRGPVGVRVNARPSPCLGTCPTPDPAYSRTSPGVFSLPQASFNSRTSIGKMWGFVL